MLLILCGEVNSSEYCFNECKSGAFIMAGGGGGEWRKGGAPLTVDITAF